MRRLIFHAFFLGLFLLLSLVFLDTVASEISLKKTTVAYREVHGHKILADVYRPQDTKIRPVIVWIHGGALIMGNRELDSPKEREDVTRFDFLAFAKSNSACSG